MLQVSDDQRFDPIGGDIGRWIPVCVFDAYRVEECSCVCGEQTDVFVEEVTSDGIEGAIDEAENGESGVSVDEYFCIRRYNIRRDCEGTD